MNTHLPLPERTMPPESAERIRAAILFEELDRRERRANRWMLGLAAALVVVALLAVAAVLWPAAPEPRIAERPSASPTPASPQPTAKSTEMPSPRPRPSNTVPLEPGPRQEPFQTDRGALTTSKARALITECNAPTEGEEHPKVDVQKVLYARRATDGQQTLDVVIYRRTDGQEWLCAPASMHFVLDDVNPDNGPNAAFPVVTDSGWSETVDRNGLTVEWTYRTRPEIERIQVRAIVEDQPTGWFEAKVDGGFAVLPIFTPGTFDQPRPDEQIRLTLEYQHLAFDKDGREVPVRVMELPG
jgi:hypothetical protein